MASFGDSDVRLMSEQFYEKFNKLFEVKNYNSFFMNREQYRYRLREVKEAKSKKSGKCPADYRRLRRYDIIKVGNEEKLIHPVTTGNKNIQYFICNEELFDILHETHLEVRHGGRNKMMIELKTKYKNITAETVMIYLNLCETCKQKNFPFKKNADDKKVLDPKICSKFYIELIDMQYCEDQGYTSILIYQEDMTKFVFLRPLKNNCPKEIADQLIDIFCLIGIPKVLKSNRGIDFLNKVICHLRLLWKDLEIAVERTNPELKQNSDTNISLRIHNTLSEWQNVNETNKWSECLKFVQYKINGSFSEETKQCPYDTFFGWGKKTTVDIKSCKEIVQDNISEVDPQEYLEMIVDIKSEVVENCDN